MAGYSGTPLPQKLGIKSGLRVIIVHAPVRFLGTLHPLPNAIVVGTDVISPCDVLLFFTKSRDQLAGRFAELVQAIAPEGSLWIVWPKRASGVPTDLTENGVREIGLAAELVDNKVCAIDEVWSGLRFVIRVKDRPSK